MNTARVVRGRWQVLVMLLISSAVWMGGFARAADIRETTSLKFVPDQVEFYSMSLRMREQFDALVQSKAYKTLSEMPVVGTALAAADMWSANDDTAAAVRNALQQEENKEAIAALLDAVSNEIFFYGSEGFGDLVRLANDVNRAQQEAQLQAMAEGGSSDEILLKKMLEKVTAALDGAKLPHSVLGLRVSDGARVKKQLARLEEVLKQALAQQPELASRLTHEKFGDTDYLTLKLDGSLIPWEKIYEEAGDHRGDVEKLAAKVKPMTLVIAIGLWQDYLIVSSGANGEHLASLGKGPRLADRKEMKILSKHMDQRVAGVGYVSADFANKSNGVKQQIDDLVKVAEQLLPKANLESDVEKELVGDLRQLAVAMQAHLPEPGAVSAVNFLTERGYEGFSYSWVKNPTVDSTQPLTILSHTGGTPIFAAAIRGKQDPKCYDAIAKIVSRSIYYAEKIGLKEADEDEKELYVKTRDALMPLLERMGEVTRDQLLPAMKDGQMAVVVDAKSTSDQWHLAMPAPKQALPMLEVATLFGVNDSEAVKKAAAEYFSIVQEMLTKMHTVRPDDVPQIQLPPPETKKFEGGEVYYYRLPQAAGLDKQIAPSMGLSKDVLAFSLLPKQTQRVLGSTPLSLKGPLAKTDRPMASMVHFNIAGLIDAVVPWVDYGFDAAAQGQENPILNMIKPQVQGVLGVLKCVQSVTSSTYQEDDIWVTHFELHLQDLE